MLLLALMLLMIITLLFALTDGILHGFDLVHRTQYLVYGSLAGLPLALFRMGFPHAQARIDRARVPMLCALVLLAAFLNLFVITGPHTVSTLGWTQLSICDFQLGLVALLPFLAARRR